jgi:chromosome partitioning protein
VQTIALLNQKGGVGKTSCAHHLAGALATMGKRVLLVDNDPQASLTQGIFGPAATATLDPGATVAALYAGWDPLPSHVVKPTGFPRIDLIPGGEGATRYNVPEPHESEWRTQECLRAFLGDLPEPYDLCLIDCPPNLHLCSWAALVASNALIVPVQPEDYGAQGLDPVQRSIARVRSGPNPGIALLGFLVTMWNPRLAIHKLYDSLLREQYGPAVFTATMPYATHFKEAIAERKTIAGYKPKSAAAKAMTALAGELLERLDSKRIATGEAA